MAMGEEGVEDRTEDATPRRRDEWRKEGRVSQSRELVAAILVLATTGALYGVSTWSLKGVWILFEDTLSQIDRYARNDWTPQTIMAMAHYALKSILFIAAPVGLAGLVASVAGTMIQTGVVWTTKPLEIDPNKLNPMNGLSR